jgi:hypothetical protein
LLGKLLEIEEAPLNCKSYQLQKLEQNTNFLETNKPTEAKKTYNSRALVITKFCAKHEQI